jgi:hypothetical protein
MIALALLELTVGEVIGDIPHDAGAMITLLIVALFVAFIWHGSRSRSRSGPDTSQRGTALQDR